MSQYQLNLAPVLLSTKRIDPSRISLTERGKILLDNSKIGDFSTGVSSAGIFFKDEQRYVKTDAMAAADVILFAMMDYYALKNTSGISSSVYGRLLSDILQSKAKMAGEDEDVFFSVMKTNGFITVYPGLYQALPAMIASSEGICDVESGGGFRFAVKHIERRLKVGSRTIEVLLSSKMRLLFSALFETLCSGYYISTKSHRRLEAVLSRISSDTSQSVFDDSSDNRRFVNLSDAFEFFGYPHLALACRKGVFDFLSSESSRSAFKISAVSLSAMCSLNTKVFCDRKTLHFFDTSFEFEENLADKVVTLSSAEIDFVRDLMLLTGSSTSLDLSTLSISSYPFSILALGEVCSE